MVSFARQSIREKYGDGESTVKDVGRADMKGRGRVVVVEGCWGVEGEVK
jgi:hypothetical protein